MPSFSISCLKTILSSSNPFYILNAIEQENGRKRSLRRSIVFAGRSVVYGMIFILCLASFSHRTWRPFELLLHFDTRTVLQKFGMSHWSGGKALCGVISEHPGHPPAQTALVGEAALPPKIRWP